ncbi:MAG: 2-oxo acid dehydrogenase subunit E2 [Betaproteobacteria bacterium]|nr:2-oxo acid dehydrogenase subunit E2 [Betaproteobacteria bacterium]
MASEEGAGGARKPANPAPRASVRRLGAMQRIAAGRLSRSHLETAPVTLIGETECDALVALRDKLNTGCAAGERFSFTQLLVKLVAQALRGHPDMNCALIDGALHVYEVVNVGVALSLPDGNLVVPVVKDADQKPLSEVARELRDLEARAAAGKLVLGDVAGGTFTLTNAGMVPGARWTTPIVFIPQCAILGTGAVRRAPVVREERIEAAWVMPTSLTFDHRAVNGVPAARFVETVHGLMMAPDGVNFGL